MQMWLGVGVNAPPDTIKVILEAVFTANHFTDTDSDKQFMYKPKDN